MTDTATKLDELLAKSRQAGYLKAVHDLADWAVAVAESQPPQDRRGIPHEQVLAQLIVMRKRGQQPI